MPDNKYEKIIDLVKYVCEYPGASFYRELYEKAGLPVSDMGSYVAKGGELPCIGVQDLIETPFKNRLYDKDAETEKFVKIISDYNTPFLVQRNMAELTDEFNGTLTNRTQILFLNGSEAIEKSMWAYSRNQLSFIGEGKSMDASAYAAKKLGIDRLMTDQPTLEAYLPFLKKNKVQEIAVTFIGDYFSLNKLKSFSLNPKTTEVILGLRETGSFAFACPAALAQGDLVFHSLPNCILEAEGNLVVTKNILMPTPIIRYRTDIFVEKVKRPKDCGCPSVEYSFSLF